jgi:chromosome segregation protein
MLAQAEAARDAAAAELAAARTTLEGQQARKAELQAARDAAGSTLAAAAPNSPGSNANGRLCA